MEENKDKWTMILSKNKIEIMTDIDEEMAQKIINMITRKDRGSFSPPDSNEGTQEYLNEETITEIEKLMKEESE